MPDLIFVTAGIRRVLQRPVVRRTIVVLVALGTAAAVAGVLRSTQQARAAWGDARPVVVAVRALEPGDVLDAAAVEVRDLPTVAVSAEALASPPAHATVREPIAAGEPVVPGRLAPTGVTGTAALVPDGHRAVGIPVGQLATPPLAPGDVVDVVLLSSQGAGLYAEPSGLHSGHGESDGQEYEEGNTPWSGGPGSSTPGAIAGARVLDVTDEVVTLSLPAPDAPTLAHAAATGVVALTLTNQ